MFKRIAFYKVKQVMDEYRIPILIGLRRTGKTTILNQLHEEIPKSVIIRFDSLEVRGQKTIDIFNNIKWLVQKGIHTFLLDEIQARKDWDVLIKDLFDTFVSDKQIKIVVTGSSSLAFENRDTGVDRTEKVLISTLDYQEYLSITQTHSSQTSFENFLGKGAFPSYANTDKTWEELSKLTLEPIINDDIPSQYKISAHNIVRLLFELSSLSNGEFNKSKSSQRTGISINQINTYLDILEKTQIIKRVYKLNIEGKLGKYPFFKVYINPHFHLWLLNQKFNELDNSFRGHIIESYWLFAATQIDGYYKKFYYLKDKDANEIDFVSVNSSGSPLFKTLHEFKYNNLGKVNPIFHKVNSLNKVIWYIGDPKEEAGITYENIMNFTKK